MKGNWLRFWGVLFVFWFFCMSRQEVTVVWMRGWNEREIESVRPTYSYILALELTGFASGLDDVTRQGIKGHTKVLAWKLLL